VWWLLSLPILIALLQLIKYNADASTRPELLSLGRISCSISRQGTNSTPPSTPVAVQSTAQPTASQQPEAPKFPPLPQDFPPGSFQSQGGQDQYLLKKFFRDNPHQQTGFFIEFGARNGIDHSNSYFFDKVLGWKGIMAEALPSEHRDVGKNRPNAAVINGAFCENNNPIEFVQPSIPGWGGAVSEYDAERLQMEQVQHWGKDCLSLALL